MRRRLSLSPLLLPLATAACGPAREPPASPPPAAPSASVAPVASFLAPPRPEPPRPREVRTPAKVACTLAGPRPATLRLFVAGDGEPWATAHAVPRFDLPAGEGEAPVVSGDSPGLRFRSVSRLTEIEPRFVTAHFFGGVFMPEGQRALQITTVSERGVSVKAKAPKGLRSTQVELAAVVPCSELTLDEDVNPDLGGRIPDVRTTKTSHLRLGVDIPVRPSPDGEPAMVVSLPKASGLGPVVWRMGTSGTMTHIFERNEDGILDGWVPSDVLEAPPPPKKGRGRDRGLPMGVWGVVGPPADEPPPPAKIVCDTETPLFFELGGVVHMLGTVPAKAPMMPTAEEGERTRVDLSESVLEVTPRAKVFVETAALRGCAKAE